MKAELIINNTRLELGHKELNEISYALGDCKKAKDIFHELAQSPSTETRSKIASQKNLHRKTIKLLLSDSQIEVMRTIIIRGKCISKMGKEDIDRFINTDDPEILTGLVNNMADLTEEYEVCEKDWICEKLYQQEDPSIRYELAENDETPEFFLKKLLEDSDINVSQAAQDTLDGIEDANFDDEDDYDDDDVPM